MFAKDKHRPTYNAFYNNLEAEKEGREWLVDLGRGLEYYIKMINICKLERKIHGGANIERRKKGNCKFYQMKTENYRCSLG